MILNAKGELLLVESPKWKGEYTIPGGHVEIGETLVEALQRELQEEVGLNVHDPELMMIQEAIFSKEFYRKRHFVFFDYMCKTRDARVKVDGVEITGFRWAKPREALEMRLDAFTRRSVGAVADRLEGKRGPALLS